MSRNRPPHHSKKRSLRKKIRLTLTILGWLVLVLAGFFLLISLIRHDADTRAMFRLWAFGYLAAGAGLFAIRVLAFDLPTHLRKRAARRQAVEPDPRAGASLVLVLGLLAVFSALLYQAHARQAASALLRQAAETDAILTTALVDAGRLGLQRLADDPDPDLDRMDDPWTEPLEWTDPDGTGIRLTIEDEQRRFDLNNLAVQVTGGVRAPGDVLLNMLVQCGEFASGTRVRSLLDWVDADTEGPREAAWYRESGRTREPANRPLLSWQELLDVDEWTRPLFDRRIRSGRPGLFEADLIDCVTLLPHPRERVVPVNLNTADRPVLLGLFGMEHEDAVDRILTFRDEGEIRELAQLNGLVDPDVLAPIQPYLDVKSRWFRIEAAGYRDGISRRLSWLVERDPGQGILIREGIL